MPTFVTRDGATLHYAVHDFTDRWRKAGTIILVHGFARSGEFWFNMIPYLARFYRVICPDLRGLGRSRPRRYPSSPEPKSTLNSRRCIARARSRNAARSPSS